ncbi:unnamed protein product [Periconia digitata]|uniref:Uncharacterized protein n=1 Tax=Periconia digitata TaxID=1303443 RepID=A0A9W4U7M6_9PLEO|nr:unnamed protein product [Periconia digitata]
MASYFDVAPAKAAPAADTLGAGDRAAIGDMGLLSPQVERILEAMELGEASSSSDEGEDDDDDDKKKASLSEPSASNATNHHHKPDTVAPRQPNGSLPPKARASLLSNKNHTKHLGVPGPGTPPPSDQPVPKGLRKSKATKPSDLSRFQSLRTMLFSTHIEQNMAKQNAELAKDTNANAEPEEKWKKDFEERKGLERTPTSDNKEKGKEKGVMKRMGSKLKRLTSKDVPTVKRVRQDDGNLSTASSDDDQQPKQHQVAKPSNLREEKNATDDDEESEIDHSDIEDLVRWVSRRDPPSDGEARTKKDTIPVIEEPSNQDDSGHESLGHSDVEDLVRWVSRKSGPSPQKSSPNRHPSPPAEVPGLFPEPDRRLSSASTQTDTSGPTGAAAAAGETGKRRARGDTISHDDVDDLVRWVSRKEGSDTGPAPSANSKKSNQDPAKDTLPTPDPSSSEDEDAEELVRWVTHKDDTSGESDIESSAPSSKLKPSSSSTSLAQKKRQGGSTLKQEVILPQAGEGAADSHASLTQNDVDDLVRWVSRRNTEAN